jgi:hypothetical protein
VRRAHSPISTAHSHIGRIHLAEALSLSGERRRDLPGGVTFQNQIFTVH